MVGGWRYRQVRTGALAIAAVLGCFVVILVVWRVSSSGARRRHPPRVPRDDSSPVAIDADTESRIVAFCGDCHAVPRAESFARDAWHDEVQQGYQFYAKSGRDDLDPPPMRLTLAYFRSRAPEQMAFPEPEEAETRLRASFAVEHLTLARNVDVPPAVSHLQWTRLDPRDDPVLLVCDMRHGYVAAIDLRGRRSFPRFLARLNNPCHAEPCDLDGDQAIDLVVADLGSFAPVDHDRGRVVWLRGRGAERSFEQIVVASGLGRVADVQPADLDADGDLDLIVAEFGHFRTGKILLLRNNAAAGERPRFEPEQLDPRPGTIHVPPHDLNGDGRMDFMALVSQEYECVEVFVNQGEAKFTPRTLWAAPDLAFGSSGIGLVDLDQDGDMDVLYTNGDAFDNSYVNPSHGVQWLENLGGLRFAYHRLTDFLGAYCAVAGDVDLDGDMDVIAAASLPQQMQPPSLATAKLPSLVCLEQTKPGLFVRHTLETGSPCHATLALADFDHDGDLDFATGSHVMTVQVKAPGRTSPPLAIWWNQMISGSE